MCIVLSSGSDFKICPTKGSNMNKSAVRVKIIKQLPILQLEISKDHKGPHHSKVASPQLTSLHCIVVISGMISITLQQTNWTLQILSSVKLTWVLVLIETSTVSLEKHSVLRIKGNITFGLFANKPLPTFNVYIYPEHLIEYSTC